MSGPPPSRRASPAFAGPLLAAGSLAFMLLLAEAAVRVTQGGAGGGKEDNAADVYCQPDPLLGWSKRPGARVVYRRREYTVEVRVNSRGLRDLERTEKPGPGVFRVLALGDSFVEGYTVDFPSTVTQVLERGLSRPDCRVEVVNGGTQAYSTDQEYLFYQRDGQAYGAQVVALFLYYNDILANDMADYWGQPKPLLDGEDGQLRVTNAPVPAVPPRSATAPAPAASPSFWRWALKDWVEGRLLQGAPRVYDALAAAHLFPPRTVLVVRDEMRVYKTGPTPRLDGAWLKTRLILEALNAEVARHGARLVLVYVPTRFEVDDRAWSLTRLRYGMDEQGWDRTRVQSRLRALAEGAGIPLLDLTAPLRQAGSHGSSPYFQIDNHWNEKGHAVAARELGRFLDGQGWLPPCARGREVSPR